MGRIARVAGLLILGGMPLMDRADAGPLDPTHYQSLGTLSLASGTYTIDSSPGAVSLVVGGTTYTGVVDNGVAVFDFDSIFIGSGAALLGTQGLDGLPIALLSRSTMTVDGLIDVSAFADSAGPGGIGDFRGADGGVVSNSVVGTGGGGGGFGGRGGQGGSDFVRQDLSDTGPTYPGGPGGGIGPDLSTKFAGGSEGGTSGRSSGGAGAGGGAIELGAVGRIAIGGDVLALGGDGVTASSGGGSGGGIYIHSSSFLLTGSLNVQGGSGQFGNQIFVSGGGGGGGGQVFVSVSEFDAVDLRGDIVLAGGFGAAGDQYNERQGNNHVLHHIGLPGSDGADGRFILDAAVPEPSSLALLGTSSVGLLVACRARRRRA